MGNTTIQNRQKYLWYNIIFFIFVTLKNKEYYSIITYSLFLLHLNNSLKTTAAGLISANLTIYLACVGFFRIP